MDLDILVETCTEKDYLRLTREPERLKQERDELFTGCNRLIREVRHLRCVMVEAASSIDASAEPHLFMHLSGEADFFVHDGCNPYPENDDHVSDQYAAFLSKASKSSSNR